MGGPEWLPVLAAAAAGSCLRATPHTQRPSKTAPGIATNFKGLRQQLARQGGEVGNLPLQAWQASRQSSSVKSGSHCRAVHRQKIDDNKRACWSRARCLPPRALAHRVFPSQGVGGYNAVSRRFVLVHLRAREGPAILVCSQAGVPRCRLDGAAAAAVAGHPPARGRR